MLCIVLCNHFRGKFVNRITFFLLSLGFLYMPTMQCMDSNEFNEHMKSVKKLIREGQLIPGNHYLAFGDMLLDSESETTETINEGINTLSVPVLVAHNVRGHKPHATNLNMPYIIYDDRAFEAPQKPQPSFNFVATKKIDGNPDLFAFAYDHSIIPAPVDRAAQYNEMKRFQNLELENSSDDMNADDEMSDSDSDN